MPENIPAETGDTFDRLLACRTEIADFVNSFTSERVQRRAFEAVACSLGLSDASAPDAAAIVEATPLRLVPDEPEHIDDPMPVAESPATAVDATVTETANGSSRGRRRGRASAKRTYSIPKGLNFAPEGHPSLEQFVAEKQPRNNDEKNLLACYYLSEMMGLTVDIRHVLAVYQAAKWNAPAQPDSALRTTASRHSWIDTHDTKNIEVVWAGKNYVNRMPIGTKKTG